MSNAIEMRRFEDPDQLLDMKERGCIAIVKITDGSAGREQRGSLETALTVKPTSGAGLPAFGQLTARPTGQIAYPRGDVADRPVTL